jgi:hypothetical protein
MAAMELLLRRQVELKAEEAVRRPGGSYRGSMLVRSIMHARKLVGS